MGSKAICTVDAARQMEMSGQLHAAAILSTRKALSVGLLMGWKAVWNLEVVWM
jgi:hypothetical protein